MNLAKIFKINDNLKEINLLPEKYRYDIAKHSIIKISVAFFILNLIFLGVFYYDQKKELNYLRSVLNEKENYDISLKNILSNLDTYKNEKNALIDKLRILKDVENYLSKQRVNNNSVLLDITTLSDLLSDKIVLNGISYTSGVFRIEGTASDSKSFYEYYKRVETNERVSHADFQNFEKIEGTIKFSLVIKLKGIL